MLALCVAVGIVIAVILVAAVNYIQNRKHIGNNTWGKREKEKCYS